MCPTLARVHALAIGIMVHLASRSVRGTGRHEATPVDAFQEGSVS